MDTISWIEKNFSLRECTSEKFIYVELDSQSGH